MHCAVAACRRAWTGSDRDRRQQCGRPQPPAAMSPVVAVCGSFWNCTFMKAAVSRSCILDFENIENMDKEEIHIRLGFNREQFSEIFRQTPSLTGSNSKTTLAIYLMKLRSGESNERLATLFQMSRRRRTLERHLKRARDCLFAEFVPRHLGFDHMDRRMVAERNLYVPNALYGNPKSELEDRKAIVIMDGTYTFRRDLIILFKEKHIAYTSFPIC